MKKTIISLYIGLLSLAGLYGQDSLTLKTPQTTGGTVTTCSSINLLPGFSFAASGTNNLTLQVNPSICDPYGGTQPSLSQNQNYILSRTYTTADGSRYLDAIQYFDGLGRPVQTVQRGVSPTAKDIIGLQEYDGFGREDKSWLPAVIAGNNGAYVDPNIVKTNAISSNGNDQKPFSMPVYEASPLNRVLKQFGPGAEWHDKGKAVSVGHLTNDNTKDSLKCALFKVAGTGMSTTLSPSGYYDNGQLYVTRTKDEDGNTNYEFKDKLGQVVLTRQMDGTTQHDTYYVYDNFGNLCFVLPPRIQDEGTSQTKLDELAYLYKYDNRNRCVIKKLPGADWIHYVYDKADRLILTQDGEQKAKKTTTGEEWLLSLYDDFGRIVATAITKDTVGLSNPNKLVKAKYTGVVQTGNIHGYEVLVDNLRKSLTNVTVLSVNYYDNYDFRSISGFSSLTYTSSGIDADYLKRYGDDTPASKYKHKGLLTGSVIAVFDNPSVPYLYSVMYYDDKKQLIQTHFSNHLTGGLEKEYIAYDFTGKPTKKMHVHSATGKTTQTEVYAYSYDHAGRLLKTTHQLTDGTTLKPQITLAENIYDELGRLQRTLRNDRVDLRTNYEYNVRSWTKRISHYHMGISLDYNPNGNIKSMNWTRAGENRNYNYTYDNLSRLKAAIYTGSGSWYNGDNYSTAYSYDKHGNIRIMQQYGKTDAGKYEIVDQMAMTYSGNQLTNVDDTGLDVKMSVSADFKDYTKGTGIEYTYNKNGAMTKDLNKGITDIQYNSLNLPRQMDIKSPVGEARNEYTYSASGVKLRVVQKWNPNYSKTPVAGSTINVSSLTEVKTTDYVVNKIYEQGSLKRILVDGGYYDKADGKYYFYMTDHLGNNRMVIAADGTITQGSHYYPFGATFADGDGTDKQPYKYNGKELDKMHGLNMYDYSARYMDPAIGRFTTVDPLAEEFYNWSPYTYCLNNPIRLIDPDGRFPFPWMLGNSNPVMPMGRNIGMFSTADKMVRATPRSGSEGSLKPTRLQIGRKTETEQLQRLGLEKNTESFTRIDPKTGREGTTIPDAIKNGQTVEIKNVKQQSLTRQLRLQEKVSKGNGKNPLLHINKDAKLSKPLQNSSFDISTYGSSSVILQDNTKVNTPKVFPADDQPMTRNEAAKEKLARELQNQYGAGNSI